SRMRNVNVMHRDPQQTRRDLAHKLPSNIYGEFIRAGKGASVRLEIINRQLEQGLKLLQFKLAALQFRREIGRFVVVAQQVRIVGVPAGHSGSEQMLGENDASTQAKTVRSMV